MIGVRATGVLREFAEAGVLALADVHVALRLSRLGAETSETVLLAVALAVRGVRTGSVCVDLATVADSVVPDEDAPPVDLPWPVDWSALQDSPLVAVGAAAPWRPLRLVDGLLYLDRYWQQEQLVRRELGQRAALLPPPVDLTLLPELFPGPAPDRQRLAAAVAAGRWVSVITGGPGTGKTHTVARLLRLLMAQPGPPPRIALAAPTGKAAARLQESVLAQAAEVGLPLDLTACTVHRLLGWRPDNRSRFRHDAGNRLPFDVVVVDESSMVPLTLMARLLEAVRPTARLVLVGDPDQLTPVEAGAVLSDLVHRPGAAAAPDPSPELDRDADLDEVERAQLRNGVVRLRVSRRYGASIGGLAEAVRTGDADLAVTLLTGGAGLSLAAGTDALAGTVRRSAEQLRSAATAGDAKAALALLGGHRLLCAHRHGPHGVSYWNEQVSRWSGDVPGEWHPGQPLLVTANDYENRLFNGDTGVVVDTADGLRAAFARADGVDLVPLSRLSSVATAHALTVHRSQGSQYEAVTVLLPPAGSPLLTRELLYTAVTRARTRVHVVGSEDAVRAAVERQVVRASGLRRPVT
ncbi:exodeoxyribonuclease V subunit alpha [Modestobacter sp. I12A-02628]|uniref:RecBCD enzyme subunit RecD n=1 Tax=Goekera deserti TaxID=2497753 RepID=A0A7K3WDQ2_9ACTN|nr:exodeoxyribonuclease V subunit alpha [Goekera deserti]MPQ97150.1 exodeoxyribonuclease V subunit alpha [Goekera deserti]NDI46532.1 exodeoxyribonuclease V subunit alpha [Goekera deserti]NEL54534.1 exodeoxyribonuclease V subunit alpha [Goekera deserti]